MTAIELLFRSSPSIELLQVAYAELSGNTLDTPAHKKLLAEVCFLLATKLQSKGDADRKEGANLARQAMELYSQLQIETLEDAAPGFWQHLPDIMHDGVVRNRLAQLLQEFDEETS